MNKCNITSWCYTHVIFPNNFAASFEYLSISKYWTVHIITTPQRNFRLSIYSNLLHYHKRMLSKTNDDPVFLLMM